MHVTGFEEERKKTAKNNNTWNEKERFEKKNNNWLRKRSGLVSGLDLDPDGSEDRRLARTTSKPGPGGLLALDE